MSEEIHASVNEVEGLSAAERVPVPFVKGKGFSERPHETEGNRRRVKIETDLIQLEDELQSHGSSIRQLLAGAAKQLLGISVAHHAPTPKEIEIREAKERKAKALADA
jgi:hypothetical protein